MRVFQLNHHATKSPKWYVDVRLPDQFGGRLRVSGFTHKQSSIALGRQIEELAAIRCAGEALRPDMRAWIASLPNPIRKRLASCGLLDAVGEAQAKLLRGHVDDFRAYLLGRRRDALYVTLTASRINAVLDGCGFTRWGDISLDKVDIYLARRMESDGISPASRNHIARAIKAFCRWGVKMKLIHENPLAGLDFVNEETDKRRVRRVLSWEQYQRLLRAALAGPDVLGSTGRERYLAYRLAGCAGLRHKEIVKLRRRDLELDGDVATVKIAASVGKSRRNDIVTLEATLADELREHCANKLPEARIVYLRAGDGAEMIRADLSWAGIEYETGDGYCDFHALRHSFCSWLAPHVMPAVLQSLARHASIATTMRYYTHVSLANQAEALKELPMTGLAGEAIQATGTDNAIADSDDFPIAPPVALMDAKRRNMVQDGATEGPSESKKGDVEKTGLECDIMQRNGDTCDYNLVRAEGLEPSAYGLKIRCSTD